MLDYLGYLWAQEALLEQLGVEVRGPGPRESLPDAGPGAERVRRRAARVLRRAADRLEPQPACH
jgi:hypothetical protein